MDDLPDGVLDAFAAAVKEARARREIMAWVAARLETWEKLLASDYDVATCRELRHALSDNPKLKLQP